MTVPEGVSERPERSESGASLKLMVHVTSERWAIPDSLRAHLVDRLAHIILDPATPHRELLSAASTILAASKINLANIAMTIQAHEHEELEDRLSELERRTERNGAKNRW